MAKTYLMPGEERTPEEIKAQSERMRKDDAELDQRRKAEFQERLKKDVAAKFVTLETLLKTRIDPQEDRIVVWPDPIDEVTAGGIIKPDIAMEKERPLTGTVIAVGPGKANDNLTNRLLLAILDEAGEEEKNTELRKEVERVTIPYAPGDRILYGRFAGTATEDPDSKTPLLIMRPSDIFAKI